MPLEPDYFDATFRTHVRPYSFLVFKEGNLIHAQSHRGKINDPVPSAIDAGAVMLGTKNALKALGGGTIIVKSEDYTLTETFPDEDVSDIILLRGEGKKTRFLASGIDAIDTSKIAVIDLVWQDSNGVFHDATFDPNMFSEAFRTHGKDINRPICSLRPTGKVLFVDEDFYELVDFGDRATVETYDVSRWRADLISGSSGEAWIEPRVKVSGRACVSMYVLTNAMYELLTYFGGRGDKMAMELWFALVKSTSQFDFGLEYKDGSKSYRPRIRYSGPNDRWYYEDENGAYQDLGQIAAISPHNAGNRFYYVKLVADYVKKEYVGLYIGFEDFSDLVVGKKFYEFTSAGDHNTTHPFMIIKGDGGMGWVNIDSVVVTEE